MAEFVSPTYVFDYRDKGNCLEVEVAKPNEEIQILVCRAEHQVLGPPIPAKGTLGEDGIFQIRVITEVGEQNHNWAYKRLLDQIRIHRND